MGQTYRFSKGVFETAGENGLSYDLLNLPIILSAPINSAVGRPATYVFAFQNSTPTAKTQADFVIPSTGVGAFLNAKIAAAGPGAGLHFLSGHETLDDVPILFNQAGQHITCEAVPTPLAVYNFLSAKGVYFTVGSSFTGSYAIGITSNKIQWDGPAVDAAYITDYAFLLQDCPQLTASLFSFRHANARGIYALSTKTPVSTAIVGRVIGDMSGSTATKVVGIAFEGTGSGYFTNSHWGDIWVQLPPVSGTVTESYGVDFIGQCDGHVVEKMGCINSTASDGNVTAAIIFNSGAPTTDNFVCGELIKHLHAESMANVVVCNKTKTTSPNRVINLTNAAGSVLVQNGGLLEIKYFDAHSELSLTRRSGTATVINGATTVVVSHGLPSTPTRVLVTARLWSNAAKAWVTTIGATQFTINVDANPGAGTAIFDWEARIGDGDGA